MRERARPFEVQEFVEIGEYWSVFALRGRANVRDVNGELERVRAQRAGDVRDFQSHLICTCRLGRDPVRMSRALNEERGTNAHGFVCVPPGQRKRTRLRGYV